MSKYFVETTGREMDDAWIQPYVGTPGTIFHDLGMVELVCTRCHTGNVSAQHVCADVMSGARRWSFEPRRADLEYVAWDGASPDACNSTDADLEDDAPRERQESWILRLVYEPWAVSGDLPGPEDVPDELAGEPDWAVYAIGSEDGEIEIVESGLTLAEAEEIAD